MTDAATATFGAFGIPFDRDGHVLLCHGRDLDLWNVPDRRVTAGRGTLGGNGARGCRGADPLPARPMVPPRVLLQMRHSCCRLTESPMTSS